MRITIVAFVLAVLLGMASAWSLFPEGKDVKKAAHDIQKRDEAAAGNVAVDAAEGPDDEEVEEDGEEEEDDEEEDDEEEEDAGVEGAAAP